MRLVAGLAPKPKLELPAERDPGHALAQAAHDAMGDLGLERRVTDDRVGVEVVEGRAVRADREPVETSVMRDRPGPSAASAR